MTPSEPISYKASSSSAFAKLHLKPKGTHQRHAYSDGSIATPTPATLHSLEDLTSKVLCNVRYIADSVAVRKEIPAAGAVAVVIEPGAEDEVGCDTEEETDGH
jgi:hypothetical protein